MKRLCTYHDMCSRDRAIVYVDGDIYTGQDHYGTIDEYFNENEDLDFEQFEKEHNVAFAHMIDDEKAVYVESNSMTGNCTMEQVAAAIKGKYPDYTIYDDDDENNTKVAKLKRLFRTADAYDWVSERADHIRSKNPDINEGEEYGIAWKQYKKENPGWKSKKQKEKEKKKKSASRLRHACIMEDEMKRLKKKAFDDFNFEKPVEPLIDVQTQQKVVDMARKVSDLVDNIGNLIDDPTLMSKIQSVMDQIPVDGIMQLFAERSKDMKKTAEFVYCEKCGFDNGDFGYPTKDTVWRTREELEKENPEHKCPYCGGELGID